MTCWLILLVHLLGLVGETWAVNIIQDGWPNGPLAAAGMNSTITVMANTVFLQFMIDFLCCKILQLCASLCSTAVCRPLVYSVSVLASVKADFSA